MAEMTPVTIGAKVSCTDGDCGVVSRVVVDPVARTVTHLAVEPKHGKGSGGWCAGSVRYVGRRNQAPVHPGGVRAARLRRGDEFVPGSGGYAEYGPEQVLSWPYYGLGGAVGVQGEMVAPISETVTYDTVPLARWRCAAAIASSPPMVPSGWSRDWSSTRAATT